MATSDDARPVAATEAAPEGLRYYAERLLEALADDDAANIHGWSVALRAALATEAAPTECLCALSVHEACTAPRGQCRCSRHATEAAPDV